MSVLAVKLRRDVKRQRGQFAAIVITILLGVVLFGATYDAYSNLKTSYASAYTDLRFANLTITGGDTALIARRARAQPGVQAVTARVQADLPMQVRTTKFLGRVVGLPAGAQPGVNRVDLEDGRHLSSSRPEGVLVEQHMADEFGLGRGDSVRVGGPGGSRRLVIEGVVASPEYFWPARSRQDILPAPKSFGVLFASESLARRLAGVRGPSQVAIYYRDGEPSASLTARLTRIADRAGASDVVTRADQPSNSALQEDVKGFQEMAIMFPLLFLTAAALATAVLMRRLVTAQRSIIGMLRACGYSRRQVTRHYLAFGLAAGTLAGVLGAAGGLLLAGAVTSAYTTELSIPVSVTELRPLTPILGIAFAVLTGLLAAGLPARRAASTPPAEAMRPFAPTGGGRRSLAERLIPPLGRLPARWLMSLRSIGRNPRRSLSTALGVVLALTLILVSWGTIDTAQILVDRQFNEIERQDAQLYFRQPLDRATIARLRAVGGVARVEPAVEVPVSVRANGRRYQTSVFGLEAHTRMHDFEVAGRGAAALPASGLLAGQALQGKLDLALGDEVRVTVPGSGLSARAPVEGFVDEPLGTYLYARLGTIRSIAGARIGLGNSALIEYEPGTRRETMRRRLSEVPGVDAFEDSQALVAETHKYLGLYYAFVGIMLAFGGAMAFALLYNAMSANIAERSVEVATLRAAGMPFRSLARTITVENVGIALVGIVPGIAVGYLVAAAFLHTFSSDQFNFDLQMRLSTPILASLAILLVALLSQWPGLRLLRRLDIAHVVRERSA